MNASENRICYYIFPQLNPTTPNLLGKLSKLCIEVLSYSQKLHENYIWYNEGFTLSPKLTFNNPDSIVPHLFGFTDCDENIDDEWLIVYILRNISLTFTDFVIKTVDCDGEFLLIEAADVIPGWLNPENADNRVFLSTGGLHILDLSFDVTDISKAVQIVRDNQDTRASSKVQNALLSRINEFPNKIETNKHYSTCFIPSTLVLLLRRDPQLLSVFIRNFVHRDNLQLTKAIPCITERFPSETRIMHRICFSRCLFARLSQERFFPPTRSSWLTPDIPPGKLPQYELGLKLSFGAAIYLTHGGFESSGVDFEKKQAFFDVLVKSGYFQNEVEGSTLHCELTRTAEEFYASSCVDTPKILSSKECLDYICGCNSNVEGDVGEGDCEDWMTIDPEKFEEILRSSSGKNVVPNAMDSFVAAESEFDGVVPSDDLLGVDVDQLKDSLRRLLLDEEEEVDEELEDLFEAMDDELMDSKMKDSFKKSNGEVDVDENMVSGFLESFVTQNGECGPVETLMKQMGLDYVFHSP